MADQKLTALTDISTNLSLDDITYVVNDPLGSPASRSATFTEIRDLMAAQKEVTYWTTVKAASDQNINTSIVLTDDAELKFDMDAAAVYMFEARVSYVSTVGAGTPDFKCTFTGPATLTGSFTFLPSYITTADAQGATQAGVALGSSGSVGTATTPRAVIMMGWAYSTGGGTGASGFRFQWAQNTSNANNVTRLAGSTLSYRKMV